jgi:hypothetical protein
MHVSRPNGSDIPIAEVGCSIISEVDTRTDHIRLPMFDVIQ